MSTTMTMPDGTSRPGPSAPDDWLAGQLLTDDQVAQILRCGTWRVAELRRTGHLASVKVGRAHRFDPATVHAFIAAGGQQ